MKQERNDEVEIDLREIMMALLGRIWIIILSAICVALAAFLVAKLLITPIYNSETKLYVMNRENEGTTTYTDLQTASQLTQDYVILVTSRPVLEEVISDLKLSISTAALESMITVSTPTNTRIIEIVVANEDASLAKEIADSLASSSSTQIRKVMNIEQVNVVEEGNYPTAPASPNVKIYVIFGALLGMFVSVLVVIIRFMMDDTIKTGDDVEKYLGLSMLAAIPYSEELDIVKNGSKKSKNNKSKNSSKKKA